MRKEFEVVKEYGEYRLCHKSGKYFWQILFSFGNHLDNYWADVCSNNLTFESITQIIGQHEDQRGE